MKCGVCEGLVLWDMPIIPYGNNQTTCQNCGAHNSQRDESYFDDEEE